MADIKRWVAYLFLYSNHMKKGPAGYARLETRDNVFKMTIHPEIQDRSIFPMKVFFACSQPGRIKGIYIGDLAFKEGKAEFVYTSPADDIGTVGLRADDLEGLLIYNSAGLYLASEWNDAGIISSNLEEIVKDEQNEIELYKNSEPESENESELENESEVPNDIIPENFYEVENSSEGFEKEAEYNETTDVESKTIQIVPPVEATAAMMAETIEKIPDSEEVRVRFEKLFASYPKMFLFNDDEYDESIRIDLGVLTRLYEKEWFIKDKRREKLEKNSFILHGFYRYRHLLMARKKADGKYLLLVPGVYNAREKKLAEMFGFEGFKCIKRNEPCVGEFGYWGVALTD